MQSSLRYLIPVKIIAGKILNKLKISSQIGTQTYHLKGSIKKEQQRFEQEQKKLIFISADILKD